jgi:ATP-binding cassette subfamily F protein 2
MYCKLVENEDKVQTTAWNKQVMDIEKLQDFIRKNMANKKTYKSAQSKQKVLDKIMETAVEKPRNTAPSFTFEFLECHRLPPPVLPFDRVSFAYSGDLKVGDVLYKDLDIGVDCDSRIALVGPNGSGKSTLLKLMSGDLQPTSGTVGTKSGCVKGFYHQHSADALDLDLSPLEFCPGPLGGGSARLAFSTMNRFCISIFYGHGGRLTALSDVFGPGQSKRCTRLSS